MTYIYSLTSQRYILSQQLLLRPILQQLLCLHDLYLQLLRHSELYCRNAYHNTKALYYSNYYVSMTHIYSSYVTTIRTVSTTIPQALYYSHYYDSMTNIYSLLRQYDPYYRNNYYVTKAYITATAMSL